jgi:hypothetical protein
LFGLKSELRRGLLLESQSVYKSLKETESMMNKYPILMICTAALIFGACSQDKKAASQAPQATPAPAEAKPEVPVAKAPVEPGVHFARLTEGAQIGTETQVSFALKGKDIKPAGEAVDEKTSGHHHLIIDGAAIAEGTVVPMDDKHLHFGKGQTSTMVKLTPGAHSLTLQFADGAHRSYGPSWSKTIKVTVIDPATLPVAAPAKAPAAK